MGNAREIIKLSDEDLKRYNRQMMIPGWDEAGQTRLKNARVFVAGAGGLGSPTTIYLAVAGVGHIALADFDSPELSNLNRQILHNDGRIGMNKAKSGKKTLEELNPAVEVTALSDKIEKDNVDELVGEADIIVDCMDNFPTRFVLNQCAMRKGIPLVHASVWGIEGKLTFLSPPETPCLQCLFPVAPPKVVFPVLGATPGVIGCLQAVETIKYLTGLGDLLKNRMLIWSGLDAEFCECPILKNPDCEICGGK